MKTLNEAVMLVRRSSELLSEEISDFEVWIKQPIAGLAAGTNMQEILDELVRVGEILDDALRALQDVNQGA